MTHFSIQDHKEPAKDRALELLVGDQIGEGAHRRVYGVLHNPFLVIKMERFEGEFMNVAEWRLWEEAKWSPKAKVWLAPCHSISGDGTALIQYRCRDLTPGEWAALGPVPAWLGDTKRSNWGWYEDPDEPGASRPVMRDYAITRIGYFAMARRKLVEKDGEGE